jgi:hypothetical protein
MRRKAIIVDLDGTLTDNTHRLGLLMAPKKDWDKISEQSAYDLPVLWCQDMVQIYSDAGYTILFVTGRHQKYEPVTREWLMRYVSPSVDYVLMMRPHEDFREDFMVKLDIYQKEIVTFYDVAFCLEDRDSVTRMWRDIGLYCLQVKDNTY